eukprot:gene17633-biopygen5067
MGVVSVASPPWRYAGSAAWIPARFRSRGGFVTGVHQKHGGIDVMRSEIFVDDSEKFKDQFWMEREI